jgi:hypothetical protein
VNETLDELKPAWPTLDRQHRIVRFAAFINGATDLRSLKARAFLADALRDLYIDGTPFLDARACELGTFGDLPGEFTLYRGAHSDAGPSLLSGVCWTRDENVAREYARGHLLTVPRIKREDILGILCDGKHETIVYSEPEGSRILVTKWPP